MKIFLTIMLITGLCVQADAQIAEPIHLSFNLKDTEYKLRKYHTEDGSLHFYIGKEHFKAISEDPDFENKCLESLKGKIQTITDFLTEATNERKRLIV